MTFGSGSATMSELRGPGYSTRRKQRAFGLRKLRKNFIRRLENEFSACNRRREREWHPAWKNETCRMITFVSRTRKHVRDSSADDRANDAQHDRPEDRHVRVHNRLRNYSRN